MKKSSVFALSIHKVGMRLICIHAAISGFFKTTMSQLKQKSIVLQTYTIFERLDLLRMMPTSIFKSRLLKNGRCKKKKSKYLLS